MSSSSCVEPPVRINLPLIAVRLSVRNAEKDVDFWAPNLCLVGVTSVCQTMAEITHRRIERKPECVVEDVEKEAVALK